jgi:hypothetical protein
MILLGLGAARLQPGQYLVVWIAAAQRPNSFGAALRAPAVGQLRLVKFS